MTLPTETEQRIIASAEKLFYQKGKAGCSMQHIADDAGINRTLLNYYFRTKDQLFEAVFRNALSRFIPGLASLLNSGISFREFVPRLITTIIDTMLEHPQIPIFVLQELSSNPDRMPQIMKEMGMDPDVVRRKLEEEPQNREGMHADPRQVILNLMSLCIFPFAAKPIITEILFKGDNEAYIAAMNQRKELLPKLAENFI